MPSTTPKQANFMNIVAKSPEFAKKVGVPQKVGKEFHAADKRKHGKKGLRAYLVKGRNGQGS